MREVKFRQYINGKMIHSGFESCGSFIMPNVNISLYPIMQSTGLIDKSGVEIYEGDIVRSNHFIDYKGEQQFLYHIIKWSDKRSAYFALNADTMNEGDGSTLLLSYFSNALGITVVGNIYENTGLLEE